MNFLLLVQFSVYQSQNSIWLHSYFWIVNTKYHKHNLMRLQKHATLLLILLKTLNHVTLKYQKMVIHLKLVSICSINVSSLLEALHASLIFFRSPWMISLDLRVAWTSIPRRLNIELIKVRMYLFDDGKILFTVLIGSTSLIGFHNKLSFLSFGISCRPKFTILDVNSLTLNDLSISQSLAIHLCKRNPPVLEIHVTFLRTEFAMPLSENESMQSMQNLL